MIDLTPEYLNRFKYIKRNNSVSKNHDNISPVKKENFINFKKIVLVTDNIDEEYLGWYSIWRYMLENINNSVVNAGYFARMPKSIIKENNNTLEKIINEEPLEKDTIYVFADEYYNKLIKRYPNNKYLKKAIFDGHWMYFGVK